MTQISDIAVKSPAGNYPGMVAPEIRRQQQREQTLEWVSRNALSALRSTWCRAKLHSSDFDRVLGSGRSA
jgi:hypothetical protein